MPNSPFLWLLKLLGLVVLKILTQSIFGAIFAFKRSLSKEMERKVEEDNNVNERELASNDLEIM